MPLKMKNLYAAMQAFDEKLGPIGSMRAALKVVGVDPDAAYVEPAKPEAARWWEIGETLLGGDGRWFYDDSRINPIFSEFPSYWKLLTTRWHGPHPTEQAAREHYATHREADEASKKPVSPEQIKPHGCGFNLRTASPQSAPTPAVDYAAQQERVAQNMIELTRFEEVDDE